ncbi:hypothetical protein [Xenorhabdus innexi]|uniref:Protein yebF n=1 Tax=Xenorhabdus innexi TaxID=290109 RepID=A0A1N6MWZ6_9GAMM|nr:hypothetical protein [Xenorhabdus innexi]PHM35959.1 exported hypothetical protein [Xenorhabdus innexi]SIP73259.1 exported hypothetical protein [Xenorhabdus innexi]
MKKFILLTLLCFPGIALSATKTPSQKALDYCATVDSWAAQKVIDAELRKGKELDREKATASLINRTKLVSGKNAIQLGEWGQLYTQTIEVSVPYIDNQKKPMRLIVSSIISAEECSLTEPAYVDMTLGDYTSHQK